MEERKGNIVTSMPLSRYDDITIKIARILMVSGEINRNELNLMFDTNEKATYYMRNHKHMFKIVKRSYKKTVQRYVRPILSRFEETPFGRLLDAIAPDGKAFEYYTQTMWNNARLSKDEAKSYRNNTIAHAVALLYDCFDIDIWNRPMLKEYVERGELIPQNTYYATSEIKWFANANGQDFEYRNSISTGTLMCENGTFVMYSLRRNPKSKVIWREGVEERYMTQVSNIFGKADCPEKNKDTNKLIISGKEEIALSICKAILSSEEGKGLPLPIDVNKCLFVPEDRTGPEIIRLLSIPQYNQKLKNYYILDKSKQLRATTEDGYIEDYVYDEDGNPLKDENGDLITETKELLLCYDNDLYRLCTALNKTSRKYNKLMIYCLDSQYELIKKILALSENKTVTVSLSTETSEEIINHITKREEDRKCS